MKAIKTFLWITAIFASIGGIGLLNIGDFDFYVLWEIVALWLAVYAIEKK